MRACTDAMFGEFYLIRCQLYVCVQNLKHKQTDLPCGSGFPARVQETVAGGLAGPTKHSSVRTVPAPTSTTSPSPQPTTSTLLGATVESEEGKKDDWETEAGIENENARLGVQV